jgi:ribosome-associated protein
MSSKPSKNPSSRRPSWVPPPSDLDAPPSKTRLKQESHDLQELGKALLELNAERFAALDLPETLQIALKDLARTKSFEGKRRQLQYVGKLMRGIDPEPLREAVAAQRIPSAKDTLALHEAEAWRERLIAEDGALTEWLARHPEEDSQALRALIRNARKEAQVAAQAPEGEAPRRGRAYRDLFALVKAGLKAEAAQAAGTSLGDAPDDDHPGHDA